MSARLKAGDTAYIVESNRIVWEVTIVRFSGGMYLIRFVDTGGEIKVKEYRLFASKELETDVINSKKTNNGYSSPYKFGNLKKEQEKHNAI